MVPPEAPESLISRLSAAASARGLALDELLAALGWSRTALESGVAKQPLARLDELWAALDELSPGHGVALELARALPAPFDGSAPVIGATIRDCLGEWLAYVSSLDDRVTARLYEHEDNARVVLLWASLPRSSAVNEYLLGMTAVLLRDLLPDAQLVTLVGLRSSRPPHARLQAELFRAPIHYEMSGDFLSLARVWLDEAPAIDESTQIGGILDASRSSDGNDQSETLASRDPDLAVRASSRESLAMSRARIGRYAVLYKLGEGGMGVVFVCYDERLGRKLAIKVVRGRTGGRETHHERMLREAQGLARLSHPNVVALYEVGEHEGSLFMAMEFVPGLTLREWMLRHPTEQSGNWQAILELLLQAGRGLEAAHAAGLVHRDFKPDNVIVGDDGRVRVLDFGLARSQYAAETLGSLETLGGETPVEHLGLLFETLTRRDALVGTLAYMAPEQLAGLPCTAAADQFAFCVVAHEALLGLRPYPVDGPGPRLQAILAGEISTEGGFQVPERARRAILRGLASDPAQRWPALGSLLAELEQVRADAVDSGPGSTHEVLDFTTERGRHEHFFGREDVLEQLDATLRELDSGWVLLLGGPGLGKSALLNRWLALRERRGCPTVFHFIRRSHKNWAEPDAIRTNLAAQIERLFPEQRDPQAKIGDRLEQLLERVSPLLEHSNAQLVLLVDGLDEAMSLGGENPVPKIFPLELPSRVFVVAASRPRYPHLNWFDRRTGAIRKLDLSGLVESNERAVREYWTTLGAQMHPPLAPALVHVAIARAQGNLLHAVKLRERWQQAASRSLDDIPEGFEGMLAGLWERLGELPRSQRKLAREGLALLCAARQSLPLNVIEELLEWDEGEAKAEFLPLVREMLLEDPWSGRPAYRPFHEGFRELVETELPRSVRKHHARLAEYAAWPPIGDEFRQHYCLGHRVAHLLAIGALDEASECCSNVTYLTRRTVEFGVLEVERELQRTATQRPEDDTRVQLMALRRVLGACSHWASEDPEALPALLHDRLLTTAPEVHRQVTWPADLRQRFPLLRHPLQTALVARVLHGHTGWITHLAVLPGGWLASGSNDGTVRIWDLESDRTMAVLRGHTRAITGLAVLSDGRLVTGSADMSLRVWDAESGRTSMVIDHDSTVVSGVMALPEGRVISGSGQGLYMWEPGSDRVRPLGPRSNDISAFLVLTDGRIVVAKEEVLEVYDADAAELIIQLRGHDDAVSAIASLSDGRVASASYDNTLRIWDLDRGESILLEGHRSVVTAVAEMVDGRLVSGSYDNISRIWDLGSGRSVATVRGHQSMVTAMVALPDGRIASGSMDHALRVWDPASVSTSESTCGHADMVAAVVATPDGRVVSGSDDKTLRVWDVETGSVLEILEGHEHWVRAIAALPDGRVVSGADDNSLRIWSLGTGQPPEVLAELGRPVTALVALPDGRVISGSTDNSLRVWDPRARRPLAVLEGHQQPISALAVLSDREVVSGSDDKTLRIWDVEREETLAILEGHESFVTAIAALSDGRVISASTDNTLRVWDRRSSTVLTGHQDYVTALAVLPGNRVVSASKDATLRVWDLETRKVIRVAYADAALFSLAAVAERLIVAGDAFGNVWMIDLDC